MTLEDDEYIDYSCSTPVERLSRDIENVLRSWHVVAGADRHISLRRQESSNRLLQNPNHVHLLRSARLCYIPPPMTATTTETKITDGHYERMTVELDLNLWDGPTTQESISLSPSYQRLDKDYSSSSPHIPFSLISHRNHFSTTQRDILSNLSSLFGIGQHITLSPVPSTNNSQFFQSTLQAIAKVKNTGRHHRKNHHHHHHHGKNHKTLQETVSSSLIQVSDFFKKRNKRISFEERVTLHTATIQSLSNILQTALNFATSSCDCRIPTFGIWGIYQQPQEILIERDLGRIKEDVSSSSSVLSISGEEEEEEGKHNQNHQHPITVGAKDDSTQLHSLYNVNELPTWLNSENLYNLASTTINDNDSYYSGSIPDSDIDTDNINHENNIMNERGDDDDDDDSPSVSTVETDSSSNEYNIEYEKGLKNNSPRPRCNRSFPSKRQHGHVYRDSKQQLNQQQHVFFAPIFCGYCYPGPSYNAAHASFIAHVVPPGVSYPIHASSLNSLGKILLQHSSSQESFLTKRSSVNPYGKVVLSFARHQFTWNRKGDMDDSMRRTHNFSYYGLDAVDIYTHGAAWRKALCPDFCHDHSRVLTHEQIQLMEQYTRILYHAYYAPRRSSRVEPLWGPKDDPLVSMNVSVTWNQSATFHPSSSSSRENDNMNNYLLALPLRIRSHQSLILHDMREMENTILSSVFNPITAPPGSFIASNYFSKDCAYGTLSANIRCILAAMIRTCSLEPDTLLGHLTKPQVLKTFQEQKSLQDRVRRLMDGAGVNAFTRNLVEALDWEDSEIDSFDWRMLAIDLLDDSRFQPNTSKNDKKVDDDNLSLPFHRLYKTCCPGSLMAVFSMCIGSLQKPSMMSALWLEIVDELRVRWAKRETISNVSLSQFAMNKMYTPTQRNSIAKRYSKGNSMNRIGDGSAFLYSSEADPDCDDCLLAQKLQVFNIGVEIMIARGKNMDNINNTRESMQSSSDTGYSSLNGGITNNIYNETETTGIRIRKGIKQRYYDSSSSSTVLDVSSQSKLKGNSSPCIDAIMDKNDVNGPLDQSDSSSEQGQFSDTDMIMKFGSPSVHSNRSSSKNVFYDARTCIETATVDIHSEHSSDIGSICSHSEDANMEGSSIEEKSVSVAHRLRRRGARCPVNGVNLMASGDQMYAPYLSRPPPMTDEQTYQRRYLLQKNFEGLDETSLNTSLEILHRLQKPKLLSDASAFKAANPGAVFQDFVHWYGNPENPITEFIGDDTVSLHVLNSKGSRNTEDNASMAAFVLSATRTFWSDVWDEAEQCPATDQRPLFDPTTTVETLLSSLETLHPSFLLNQILSVNLALACFLLETSIFFCNLTSKENILDTLLSKVHDALVSLNHDMTLGISSPINKAEMEGEQSFMISYETIAACERACDVIGETEVLLSQASSLLSKFDGDSFIVEEFVLKRTSNTSNIDDKDQRRAILNAIGAQQELHKIGDKTTITRDTPHITVKEYTLRTIDHKYPSEMSVRLGDSGSEGENNPNGGIVLSITKCNQ